MAVVTKTLKDGDAVDFTVQIQDVLGRQDAANAECRSLSNEDKAALDAAVTALQAMQADTSDQWTEPHSPGDVVTVTPTLDTTGAYAVGDVLFNATSFVGARTNDKPSQLQSISLIDKENQKPGLKLKFYSAAVTYGTANAAPSISDADQANFLTAVDVAPTDWDSDGTLNATAYLANLGRLLKPASGTAMVYVAAKVTSGTPTYTSTSSLVIRLGVWFG